MHINASLIQLFTDSPAMGFSPAVGPVVYVSTSGGSPRVVVSTAAFHARVWGSVPGLGDLKETKNVSFPSTCESHYCGEPP